MDKKQNTKELNGKKINANKNNKKIKRKKSRKLMKLVISTLMIIIIISCGLVWHKIKENGGGLSGILATALGSDKKTLENLDAIQILVMGISGVDDYKLADTIMVVSYNPKSQSASLMSIPRDTYVGKKDRTTASQNYIASYKINTVFRNGTNIPEAMDRINDVTGLNLKNYVIIDTNALVQLVDAIGGITFNVPINMQYDDDEQNLHINLKAGEQLINGSKAEQLLRFRHNNDGSTYPSSYGQQDLGRMRTQREFVTATLKQTLKPLNIFKIKDIMDIMANNVKTNMEVSTLKQYVPYIVNFNADELKTGMLPGDVEMCNGVSIYIASKQKTKTLINELFPKGNDATIKNNDNTNKETSESLNKNNDEETKASTKAKIEILNGSGSDSSLNKVVKKLKESGYTVSKQGSTNITSKTSIINRTNIKDNVITEIKSLLGTAAISKGTNTSNVDITIILGKDFQ